MAAKLTTPQWVIVGSGLVAFVTSFLPFVDTGDATANAWEDVLYPTYTWPALFGLAMAAAVLVAELTDVSIPARIAGIPLAKVFLVAATFALLLMFSFMIAFNDFGVGFWLSFLASIALLVGAVMHDHAPSAPAGA